MEPVAGGRKSAVDRLTGVGTSPPAGAHGDPPTSE
jgi:hypothetical protein